ncbi:MAG: hypothetical protein ABIJ85_03075 [bacterium]
MFNGWTKKIDDWEERQRIEAERRRQEAEACRLEAIKAEKEARLQHLGKFKCHICGMPAGMPARRPTGRTHEMPHDPGSGSSSVAEYVDDWSRPGDLFKCNICHKLTCAKHIYKGICQKCAEKL